MMVPMDPRGGAATSILGPDGTGANRDGFLDTVKALALWRVVVWHAVAWPWLSWFAAMPAMFYVAGVLLARSLDRHGYRATLMSRLRRLLLPFWAYAAVAVTLMLAAGWRASAGDLVWWALPLGDPPGIDSSPGLWVPLWYLRAYLWVVVAGPALVWVARRWGVRALMVPVLATGLVWWWQRTGGQVPLAVADAALFPFFVLAGMITDGRSVSRRAMATIAVAAGTAALVWNAAFAAPEGIVNSSTPLHLLVGVATVVVLLLLRPALSRPTPPVERFVAWSGRRSLTVYLWHGLGLVVADRTVHSAEWSPPLQAVSGLLVVLVVTVAATVVMGWAEDLAARRPRRRSPKPALAALVPALVLAVAASQLGIEGRGPRLVPSGQVVLARAATAEVVASEPGEVEPGVVEVTAGTLDQARLQAAFDAWVEHHGGLLDDLGTGLIEVALIDHADAPVVLQWSRDGGPVEVEPFPWWSMSKTMTAAWMMQLAGEGVISLDEPLVGYLDTVPFAEVFTFGQLAGHRGGLPSSIDRPILSASPIDEIGAWFDEAALGYEPGEGFDYSRVGYHILTWGLEEASGSEWRSAMEAIAAAAGAEISIDEDYIWSDRVTHPGSGNYRGALWGAGGLHGTTVDGARLMRWTFVDWLDPGAVQQMVVAPATGGGPEGTSQAFYGLGTMPFCPCRSDGDQLWSDRVGLSTITGAYVVDLATGVGTMLRTDNWWGPDGVALEFDDLIRELLDTVVPPRN